MAYTPTGTTTHATSASHTHSGTDGPISVVRGNGTTGDGVTCGVGMTVGVGVGTDVGSGDGLSESVSCPDASGVDVG